MQTTLPLASLTGSRPRSLAPDPSSPSKAQIDAVSPTQPVATPSTRSSCQALCGLLFVLGASPARAKGVVDASFVPSPQATAVCTIVAAATGHRIEEGPKPYSLQALNAFAQAHLRRPKATERMAPESLEHYAALHAALSKTQRRLILDAFLSMGDLGAQRPKHRQYDYILIHGTTVQGMRARVMAVAEAVRRNQLELTPATSIIFLDGERALFRNEGADVLTSPAPYPKRSDWTPPTALPTDERGAAELVWDQLDLPEAMRFARISFIHAAKKQGAARAETEDTVAAWAQTTPDAQGVALMVSENPVIEYQRLVTQTLLHRHGLRHVHLDAMGPDIRLRTVRESTRIGYLLDNLAACLYWAQVMQTESIPLR